MFRRKINCMPCTCCAYKPQDGLFQLFSHSQTSSVIVVVCSRGQSRRVSHTKMPLRARLPLISPSAVPAPKYSGRQQYGPRRPSFWKSESDRYWDKCRHKKQSARRKTVGLAVVVFLVVVVAVMLFLAAGLRGGTASAAE